jgi:WD40 repeat protein
VHYDRTGNTSTVLLWALRVGPGFATLVAKHKLPLQRIRFSRDLQRFAAWGSPGEGGLGREVNLYDLETGEVLASKGFQDEVFSINDLYFSLNETKLIAATGDGDLHFRYTIWDMGNELREVASFTEEPIFTNDERWVVIAKKTGAELLDARSMNKSADFMRANDRIYPPIMWDSISRPLLLCSPDSKTVVISHLVIDEKLGTVEQWIADRLPKEFLPSRDIGTRVWSTESGRQVAALPWLYLGDFSPDGRALVALQSDDGIITVWDMPPRRPVLRVLYLAVPVWLVITAPLWLYRLWLRRKSALR